MDGFSSSVSRRTHDGSKVDVWTTSKVGARVESSRVAKTILEAWSQRQNAQEAEARVADEHKENAESSQQLVHQYDAVLHLWQNQHATERRLPNEINSAKEQGRSSWATAPSSREHTEADDGYRLQYQRDRDRILWSSGLRRLADKTQLFPVEEDDQVRQRLAHSIEVLQLASTIAESFGLDRDLVEAAALAHDIGHAPFGHAGEIALDKALRSCQPSLSFNHYEQGADVVRFIDDSYQNAGPKSHPGLDLVPEVCEAILKHTYLHDQFRSESKHVAPFIPSGYCHLEGQAVRIADKISYLVSDLEDGIRLGAIPEDAIAECRLFHRPPIDMSQPRGASALRRYLVQRRHLIRVLMEDVITATGMRLANLRSAGKVPSIETVRSAQGYLVDHSAQVSTDVKEVWSRLQVGFLHRDPRVRTANMGASRIVSDLFVLFAVFPEYIDIEFRSAHSRLSQTTYMEYYRRQVGKDVVVLNSKLIQLLPLDPMIDAPNPETGFPLSDVIAAKDYVASLTDTRARSLHAKYSGHGGWAAR